MALRTRQAGPGTTLILGIVFVIGGFFAMKFGQKTMDQAKASLDWPSIQGKIVHSDVARKRSDNKTMYSADIIFSYAVNGRKYESNQRRIGGSSSSSNSSSAYKIVNKYPEGQAVEAYYNPEAPEEAVLEPGAFLESRILWYIGIVFFVIGILMTAGIIFKILLIGGFLLAKR